MRYANEHPLFEVVVPALEPHFDALRGLVRVGLSKGIHVIRCTAEEGIHPPGAWKSFTLTMAIVHHAQTDGLSAAPIQHLGRSDGLEVFRLDEVLFSFKKSRAGRRALAQNHESKRQDRVRQGQGLLEFPQQDYVFVVYRMDDTFTELLDLSIACPSSYQRNHWSHSFLDPAEPMLFPFEESPRPSTPIVPAEQPKTKIRKKSS